jgi:hypothetical protein
MFIGGKRLIVVVFLTKRISKQRNMQDFFLVGHILCNIGHQKEKT